MFKNVNIQNAREGDSWIASLSFTCRNRDTASKSRCKKRPVKNWQKIRTGKVWKHDEQQKQLKETQYLLEQKKSLRCYNSITRIKQETPEIQLLQTQELDKIRSQRESTVKPRLKLIQLTQRNHSFPFLFSLLVQRSFPQMHHQLSKNRKADCKSGQT